MDPDPGGQKHVDPVDPDPEHWKNQLYFWDLKYFVFKADLSERRMPRQYDDGRALFSRVARMRRPSAVR